MLFEFYSVVQFVFSFKLFLKSTSSKTEIQFVAKSQQFITFVHIEKQQQLQNHPVWMKFGLWVGQGHTQSIDSVICEVLSIYKEFTDITTHAATFILIFFSYLFSYLFIYLVTESLSHIDVLKSQQLAAELHHL